MKTILNQLTLVILVVILLSFIRISPQDGVTFYELKQNDTILFKDGPHTSASYKRGSYDKTTYDMYLTKKGGFYITELNGCKQKNQSEIEFHNCYGSVTRNSDTLRIVAESYYKNFYIISII